MDILYNANDHTKCRTDSKLIFNDHTTGKKIDIGIPLGVGPDGKKNKRYNEVMGDWSTELFKHIFHNKELKKKKWTLTERIYCPDPKSTLVRLCFLFDYDCKHWSSMETQGNAITIAIDLASCVFNPDDIKAISGTNCGLELHPSRDKKYVRVCFYDNLLKLADWERAWTCPGVQKFWHARRAIPLINKEYDPELVTPPYLENIMVGSHNKNSHLPDVPFIDKSYCNGHWEVFKSTMTHFYQMAPKPKLLKLNQSVLTELKELRIQAKKDDRAKKLKELERIDRIYNPVHETGISLRNDESLDETKLIDMFFDP
jgi:hypothetical protein